MRLLHIFCLLSFLLIWETACVPPQKSDQNPTGINLSDPATQKLLLLENQQKSDSLAIYFSSDKPLQRLMVARAMASIQNVAYGDSLVKLLHDPYYEVKAEAAYALGQLKDTTFVQALMSAFAGKDSIDVNNPVNASILEALGKSGSAELAAQIASVETYRLSDTLLLKGQMYALFRFGLRDISPENIVPLCMKYLASQVASPKVRLIAAHILARSKNIDLRGNNQLTELLKAEQDVYVKMALALAAGKNNDESSRNALRALAVNDADYRVRCNAVKSLSPFISEQGIIDTVLMLSRDNNVHVANTAADLSLKIKNPTELVALWRADSMATRPMVKAKLLQTIMNNHSLYLTVTKEFIKNMAVQRMNASADPFVRAEYIKVLGYDPYQYLNLINLPVKSKLEELAKLSALNQILNGPDFNLAYKNNVNKVRREIFYYIVNKVSEGDAGVAAEGALILADEKNQAKTLITDTSFIDIAWDKLAFPRDLETMQNLNKLSTYLYGTAKPLGARKFKEINFDRLTSLQDSATVVVKTTRGNITILLFPKHAPITVSSFLELCKSDFYDDKIFHRVVPNFVIQTGCPRGDGYGGVDFVLPSEVDDLKYDDEGFVGMASAGLHTEGSQFFITHSPTPHLDGRYTIFGKVISGMDVVHRIEVGDKIIDAILTK